MQTTMFSRGAKTLLCVLFTAYGLVGAWAADSEITFRKDMWELVGIEAVRPQEWAHPPLTFRAEQATPGKARAVQAGTLNRIGGVLFLEEAVPAKDASGCPELGYDVSRPNGQRFHVNFRSRGRAYGDIFDWEVVPVVRLVESGDHGIFSYMGRHAEYHKAFSNNLAGVNFFFLDNARTLGPNFAYIHLTLGRAVPGYPQAKPTEESERRNQELLDWFGHEQVVFTDEGVKFVFNAANNRFSIAGAPYWIAVTRDRGGGDGKELRRFSDSDKLLKSNPIVYGSAFRVARYASFFRYMVAHCSTQWTAFTAELGSKRGSIDVVRVAEVPLKIK